MFIPLLVIAIGLLMLCIELTKPGRSLPKVTGWWSRVILLNAIQILVIFVSTFTWDALFQNWSLLSLTGLTATSGGFLGYFILTFVYYWWHRWRHEVTFLWRWFHQVHHSPKRLELVTAFYKHPIEQVGDSLISSFVLYVLLGLNTPAVAGAVLLSGLAELFYHWNVNTPRWIGYFLQRPESHCIHHQEGVHHYNYADLPLWDMLFGTFRNPKVFKGSCGLGEGEHRLAEMLVGVDVDPIEN